MKYCKYCKKAFPDEEEKCRKCSGELTDSEELSTDSEVLLISCSGIDKDIVVDTLEYNDLAFRTKPVKVEKYSNETAREKYTSYDIFVLIKDIEKARELMHGINKNVDFEDVEATVVQDNEENEGKSVAELLGGSRVWRIVALIIFLALATLVVFATDYIMGLVKSFIMS